jgi:hypothetical protein
MGRAFEYMIFFMYFQMTCKFSNYFLLSCYLSITDYSD